MQSKTISGLKNWVNFFNKAEIPVLKLTSNELFLLLQQEKILALAVLQISLNEIH